VMTVAQWDSLEAAKLAVAALTPLVVVGLGFVVTRAVGRLEDAQWANRKVIERRLELYDKMAPHLNDLLCFFTAIGHFREINPPAALARKRELDKAFHVNRHLMGDDFSEHYTDFVNACFRHYTGVGQDAQLRASVDHQRKERRTEHWDESWNDMFVVDPDEVTDRKEIALRYEALMRSFSDQVGVRHASDEAQGKRARDLPSSGEGRD
jgi:hypothetical protein